jgi:hypothetical protein
MADHFIFNSEFPIDNISKFDVDIWFYRVDAALLVKGSHELPYWRTSALLIYGKGLVQSLTDSQIGVMGKTGHKLPTP